MNENPLINSQAQLLIVTGYSGAGKSTVLRALEDIGFFCVDNLPIPLLNSFFQLITQSTMMGQKVALGIDIRSGQNIQDLITQLKEQTIRHYLVKIFFLTSSLQVLVKRYQETRRKHPLSNTLNLEDAIKNEQELLKPLMELSDLILDTDQLNIHQLRKFVRSSFAESAQPQLLVNLTSFGFKYGIPPESNFIFDVRSLPNPYFVSDLRPLDGTSPKIKEFLFSHNEVQDYWHRLQEFIHYSIKKSYEEGRFFTNIAIGCTGGRHRSVAFVQELATHALDNIHYVVKHRDILQHTMEDLN
jgi:RNase adapter protein RapZ